MLLSAFSASDKDELGNSHSLHAGPQLRRHPSVRSKYQKVGFILQLSWIISGDILKHALDYLLHSHKTSSIQLPLYNSSRQMSGYLWEQTSSKTIPLSWVPLCSWNSFYSSNNFLKTSKCKLCDSSNKLCTLKVIKCHQQMVIISTAFIASPLSYFATGCQRRRIWF